MNWRKAIAVCVLGGGTVLWSANPALARSLEDKYFEILDGWVQRGGPTDEVQETVVKTCGELVMYTASASEKLSFMTYEREEFHFRVDACTKMTAHRLYPQPEFQNREIVKMICHESEVPLFKKLCKRAQIR